MLDSRNAPERLREIAAMCDGAGIDALWVRDRAPSRERLDAWAALTHISSAVHRVRMGVTLSTAFQPVATLAAMVATLDSTIGGRLELCLTSAHRQRAEPPEGLREYADRLRELLSGTGATLALNSDPTVGASFPQPEGPPLSVEAKTPDQIEVAVGVADDVLLPAGTVADLVAATSRVRAACEHAHRDPATLGIALEAPLSIGRTRAEAEARAHGEPVFASLGAPSEVGVFGSLEECQERVVELAHAGISDLRLVLPNNPDIHDVIAQLTAIAVGTVDVLTPGAPRSKDPDPPETWGGRRSRPATG